MMIWRTFTVLILLMVAMPAAATTTVRTAAQFELPSASQIDGNFLVVGTPVTLSGTVTGDATAIGNRVLIPGLVTGDTVVLSILSSVSGVINDDLRLVSGDATISGTVTGDVLVLSGSLQMLPEATITGDVVLYGDHAVVSGTIGGNVLGSVRELTIDGAVGGGVDVVTRQLTLGETASITKAVQYTSGNLVQQTIHTNIGGGITRIDPAAEPRAPIWRFLAPLLVIVFATLVWLLLSRKTLHTVTRRASIDVFKSTLLGLAFLIMTPGVLFVLSVSLLGGYLALMLGLVYLLLLLLAAAAVPMLLGRWCCSLVQQKTISPFPTVAVGAIVTGLLFLVPIFGLYLFLILVLIQLGGILLSISKHSR